MSVCPVSCVTMSGIPPVKKTFLPDQMSSYAVGANPSPRSEMAMTGNHPFSGNSSAWMIVVPAGRDSLRRSNPSVDATTSMRHFSMSSASPAVADLPQDVSNTAAGSRGSTAQPSKPAIQELEQARAAGRIHHEQLRRREERIDCRTSKVTEVVQFRQERLGSSIQKVGDRRPRIAKAPCSESAIPCVEQ